MKFIIYGEALHQVEGYCLNMWVIAFGICNLQLKRLEWRRGTNEVNWGSCTMKEVDYGFTCCRTMGEDDMHCNTPPGVPFLHAYISSSWELPSVPHQSPGSMDMETSQPLRSLQLQWRCWKQTKGIMCSITTVIDNLSVSCTEAFAWNKSRDNSMTFTQKIIASFWISGIVKMCESVEKSLNINAFIWANRMIMK